MTKPSETDSQTGTIADLPVALLWLVVAAVVVLLERAHDAIWARAHRR